MLTQLSSRNKDSSKKKAEFWPAFFIFFLIAAVTVCQADEIVSKSPNDEQQYEYFELPNQLKVLIVSDPAADKAAASLDVNIGSASDPTEYQGLAHFLEHMLFLGTEKYPEAGGYKLFISTHGGTDNAYTALENTNYFFDIDKEHLEPALDRFAQFFIAPLFTAKYVDRERQIVHSEYQSKLKSDGWRIRSAQKHALNPKHPAAGFNVGSVETLADKAGQSVRDQLIGIYEQHYSANLMTLVVLGKEPLPVLRQWVTEKFSAIANHDIPSPHISEPMFSAGSLPLRMDVVPVKDNQRMTLTFPIPPLQPHYLAKPVNYIANLLGHEGKGSLLSFLKSQGWVEALSAGAGDSDSNGAVLNVSIELTATGLNRIDAIISSVFQYLRLIEHEGIRQWIFHEQQQLAEVAFRFQEQMEPVGYVSALAANLHDYPAADVLRGPYAMDLYDPDLIREYLTYLRPDNMMLTVSAPGLETDAIDPWFDVAYRITPIDAQQVRNWRQETINNALAIAEPNPFIPEDLALKPAADNTLIPEKIESQPGFDLWYQQDTTFRVPRAEFYFTIRSPIANDNPRHSMLTELYVKLVNDLLTEFSYPAYLAGLDYRLYKHVRGISVRISGYDDKQDELLTQILQTLSNPVIDVVRFEQSKDEIRRDLKNAGQNPPYRQTYAEIMNLLLTPYWSDEESLAALEPLNVEDLKKFIPDLLKQVSVVALAYGNVDRDEASTLAQTLQESLLKQAEPVAVERGRLLKLDGQNNYVRQLDIDNDDSALLVYVQADDKSYANRARFALLGQILESPFFEDLRTENQLGYIVFASPMPLLEVPGLAFAVQSPIADPIELENHVERFITSYSDTLQNMSEEEFAKHKLGLLTGILQAERTPQEKAERYWTEIDREDYGFDSRQKLAVAVEAITKNDLVATYRQALLSKPQKRLVIRSIGNRHKEKFLAKEKDLQELLIADPSAFKQDRAAFPG